MKAIKFLSTCSVALALMMVAPALAQVTGPLPVDVDAMEEIVNRDIERDANKLAPTPLAVPFVVRQVAVECNGNCNDSTLGQICGAGWTPIAVDCQNVQEQAVAFNCGGNNSCSPRFLVRPGDRLSFYCDDINGWDANVYCAN